MSPRGGSYVCPGSVTLDGVALDPSASYRVTMNAFVASGGDNFSVFELGTNASDAGMDLDAFEAHLAARSPLAPGPRDRIQKVAACP